MRAYATWQVAHQLARTSQSGRPTVSAQKYARSLVNEAIKLTCWLHAQQLELRDLRQDLLDAWIADGPGIRRRVRLFTAWLQRADVTGALHVDWPYDFPQRPPLQDEQRFAVLRRLLHDHDIGLRERFAGSVLLLYAQPLTRIAQLRTSDITTADSGETAITVARGADRPPGAAGLDRARPALPAHLRRRAQTAGCSRAASPGRTSPPSTCASAWHPTASPAVLAATARCSPSPAGSRHRSSPSASASTKPAPRNGPAPPAPPTAATSSSVSCVTSTTFRKRIRMRQGTTRWSRRWARAVRSLRDETLWGSRCAIPTETSTG